jgi:hypothetical protein
MSTKLMPCFCSEKVISNEIKGKKRQKIRKNDFILRGPLH